jgi:hypothetical protein
LATIGRRDPTFTDVDPARSEMDTDIAPLIAALRPTLGRRGAVVFVHPSELPGPDVPGIPAFAADYLHDTTRAALDLVRAGTVRRHPDLKIILSHGGGYVPYAAYRFAAGLALTEGRTADELPADFGTFYFETGLSTSPAEPAELRAPGPSRLRQRLALRPGHDRRLLRRVPRHPPDARTAGGHQPRQRPHAVPPAALGPAPRGARLVPQHLTRHDRDG